MSIEDLEPASNSKMARIERNKRILNLYLDGKTTSEIAVDLGLREQYIDLSLTKILDHLVNYYSRPSSQHTFIRYACFQMRLIHLLQEAYDEFMRNPSTKGRSALISSLRAQSDIYDKIFDRGLEFGVIQKEAAKSTSEVLHKTPEQLRIQLKTHITELTLLLDQVDTDVVPERRKPSQRIYREVARDAGGNVVYAGKDWKELQSVSKDEEARSLQQLRVEYAHIKALAYNRPLPPKS